MVSLGRGDEGVPLVPAVRHPDWAIPDPKHLPPERFREVRDRIEQKVQELLATLWVFRRTRDAGHRQTHVRLACTRAGLVCTAGELACTAGRLVCT